MRIMNMNLEHVKTRLQEDKDSTVAVIGYEGSGKSTLAIQVCTYVDPTFNPDRICLTAASFEQAIHKAKPFQVILLDEGVEGLFSRRAMSSETTSIVKLLTQCRAKNLFIVIAIPDFFLLESYVRRHRIMALLRVLETGKFCFYSRRRMNKIKKEAGTGFVRYPKPNFYDNFEKLEGKLWEGYYKKKMTFVNSGASAKVWKKREKLQKKMKKSYTLRDISTMTGLHKGTIQNYFYSDKKLFSKRETFKDLFGMVRVTEKGLNIFLKRKAKMHSKRKPRGRNKKK